MRVDHLKEGIWIILETEKRLMEPQKKGQFTPKEQAAEKCVLTGIVGGSFFYLLNNRGKKKTPCAFVH